MNDVRGGGTPPGESGSRSSRESPRDLSKAVVLAVSMGGLPILWKITHGTNSQCMLSLSTGSELSTGCFRMAWFCGGGLRVVVGTRFVWGGRAVGGGGGGG